MNEEEKENIELDIEAKYVDKTEKEFLSRVTYAECLYILTPENKYCDKIRELSLLKLCEIIDKLQKENEELKNIELKSKGGAIKISLDGILSLENKIKQLEKENKELELEIKNREFLHMNLYNEYKYYKQFKSLSIETIKNKIEYLDKQQADWIEDRELKVSDSEIIFARDTLEKLLEDNYEKF